MLTSTNLAFSKSGINNLLLSLSFEIIFLSNSVIYLLFLVIKTFLLLVLKNFWELLKISF